MFNAPAASATIAPRPHDDRVVVAFQDVLDADASAVVLRRRRAVARVMTLTFGAFCMGSSSACRLPLARRPLQLSILKWYRPATLPRDVWALKSVTNVWPAAWQGLEEGCCASASGQRAARRGA